MVWKGRDSLLLGKYSPSAFSNMYIYSYNHSTFHTCSPTFITGSWLVSIIIDQAIKTALIIIYTHSLIYNSTVYENAQNIINSCMHMCLIDYYYCRSADIQTATSDLEWCRKFLRVTRTLMNI